MESMESVKQSTETLQNNVGKLIELIDIYNENQKNQPTVENNLLLHKQTSKILTQYARLTSILMEITISTAGKSIFLTDINNSMASVVNIQSGSFTKSLANETENVVKKSVEQLKSDLEVAVEDLQNSIEEDLSGFKKIIKAITDTTKEIMEKSSITFGNLIFTLIISGMSSYIVLKYLMEN